MRLRQLCSALKMLKSKRHSLTHSLTHCRGEREFPFPSKSHWQGQLLSCPRQLKRQVWIFKEKIYENVFSVCTMHIGSSLPEVECLDNLSSPYLLISIPFVTFPICPPTLWGKKLSMMAFVKRDKSKATVVFRRKRQKVQLQNTEGKGNSYCMIKRKFLEINFHKIPFPPPFRRGHCPARRKNHQSTRPQYL